jgi:hypothetical protein
MSAFVYLSLALVLAAVVWSSATPPLIVGQSSFTLYYSMSCPHCVKAMPDWLKLGSSMNGVVIRRVQGDTAEYPVQGFPTIVYRSEDGLAEEYSGGRTVGDYTQFLSDKEF